MHSHTRLGTIPAQMRPSLIVVLAALCALGACDPCDADSVQIRVLVHAPHPSLVPRHCTGASSETCRDADRISGLTYAFDFESRAEGTLWCSFADLAGEIRTRGCETRALPTPEESGDVHLDLECDLTQLDPPAVGDRCEVRSVQRVQEDSCGDGLFCSAQDSRCARLPDHCERDFDCRNVRTCDDTGLCVRFACGDGVCVWPDECLDTSDCQRSHSRCDAHGCDTFTCETGRCVGVAPSTRR